MVIIKSINCEDLPNNFTGKKYFRDFISFIKNNKLHRYYGPALISEESEQWWINGKHYGSYSVLNFLPPSNNFLFKFINKIIKPKIIFNYSQKQFLKDINKSWLL